MKIFEQADDKYKRRHKVYHRHLKIAKRRWERHKAKQNPEHVSSYGKYRGYEL